MSFETPGPVEAQLRDAISPIEDIIEEARKGRMYILVDHEDRENEGDLVIAAEFADADAINFMATHGRGLICLPMTAERIEALGLPMMAVNNSSRHETAFTVSIEAREGVSTGISAADRALTVATAINEQNTMAHIATPGHVFPLRAKRGGVLVRAGHTEAAVDISRLAGLKPAGVICEIMRPDGTMARLPDLVEFAKEHDMKIGTISDLIAYRSRNDNLVVESSREVVTSEFGGEWEMRIFTDQTHGIEHVVMVKGDITTPEPVLTRTHALHEAPDIFGPWAKIVQGTAACDGKDRRRRAGRRLPVPPTAKLAVCSGRRRSAHNQANRSGRANPVQDGHSGTGAADRLARKPYIWGSTPLACPSSAPAPSSRKTDRG